MKELEELFLHELKDIYDAEHRLVDATENMSRSSTDPELRQAFRDHCQETKGQVKRLREVFDALGKRPQKETCAGIVGLIKEHQTVVKEIDPAGHVMDIINMGAAQKVERYEMTAYEGLISLAEQLGHTDVVDLLNENLMEEQAAFEKIKSLEEEYDVEAAATRVPDEAPRRTSKATSKGKTQRQTAVVGGGRGKSTSRGDKGGARKGAPRGGNKRKSTRSTSRSR